VSVTLIKNTTNCIRNQNGIVLSFTDYYDADIVVYGGSLAKLLTSLNNHVWSFWWIPQQWLSVIGN